MVDAYVNIITETGEVSNAGKEIDDFDEVKDIHVVTGDYDIIVQLELNDREDLPSIVSEKIHSVDGVIDTVTNVAFSIY